MTDNKTLYAQSERLVRKLRNSPKLWDDDTTKIDRVLVKAKARMLHRRTLPGVQVYSADDRMLFLYA